MNCFLAMWSRWDFDLLWRLISNVVEPNCKDNDQGTLLRVASSRGLSLAAKLPSDVGASVSSKDMLQILTHYFVDKTCSCYKFRCSLCIMRSWWLDSMLCCTVRSVFICFFYHPQVNDLQICILAKVFEHSYSCKFRPFNHNAVSPCSVHIMRTFPLNAIFS